MSSYTKARCLPIGGGLYRVVSVEPEGMWFYVGDPDGHRGILVPNGFITDGPSLPSWLQTLLRSMGLLPWVRACLMKASIVHDFMREDREFSLLESDCYFLIAMKADQVNWIGPRWACDLLCELAFMAVRTNSSRISRNADLVANTAS